MIFSVEILVDVGGHGGCSSVGDISVVVSTVVFLLP